ncbi:LLM class F420-dependent oxidoreductase [Mycobacteroides franklinii]|uniref:F420-dependent glucose-6-phosphate dehydrogenase n=1 Tax=Mycobacteroides franklinii TaxID=948102 RepID=A0A4R8QZ83_9MYCO|nr:LLM class F420-dependent oxidoreductase [Mycobacteroides franklinii]TDZ44602.1 F420-dependent glucose-6-phosphate dehydrogenase [Mycobacteroides franklinii]TDZ47508.1 F420-dependent glucose-6-phosphate dehydrogenase [Mycobacteroides franklinii]TDZ58156.1 F420-dependent glucose-6-phosphate dehydrogenase [Mycobacteroides franklinii]TDZ61266.1 F420-dependent glucose-6-phosphate dehydrogenase [Mycobacteroides franklinii]TDZ71495.1 F420-dependent glucose-6-phosphate dehydrogenase [Mycobacteroide
MKIGVVAPVELGITAEPDKILEFAHAAEQLGFSEISVVEHAVVIGNTQSTYPYSPTGQSHLPDDVDIPDPLELLSFVAAATTTLGLSTGVLVLPDHHPVVLAKRLATVDRLSRGRLRICLGVGWMREEIEACGGDFDRRGRATDEAIAVMRALWSADGPAAYDGAFYRFQEAYSYPKPVQPQGVPLYVGGHSKAAARRAGRLGSGFQPLGLVGEDLAAAVSIMRTAAVDAGRDPASIDLVLGHGLHRVDHAALDQAAQAGAGRMLLSASRRATTLEAVLDEMAQCATRLELAGPR